MDWIEECLGKCRNRIKNFSLRKSLVVYLLVAVLLTIVLVVLTCMVCSSWQNVIREINEVEYDYRYVGDGDFVAYRKDGSIVMATEGAIRSLNQSDNRLYDTLSMIQILCIPFYAVAAIFLVSVIYFRNKLREPISLLKTEMEAIRRGDLHFSCRYDSADEMGELCGSVDSMRCAVVENQKTMWELMEEQRKVNAAFAHDLRTPLTVIDGYVEMLLEYYPKGQIKEKQLLDILFSIKGQTKRMKEFSQTMKEVQDFETLELKKAKHKGGELETDIRNMIEGLKAEGDLSIEVNAKLSGSDLYYDENVIMEVLGNLLSNAMRYGKEKIDILAEQQGNKLFLYVKDDGRGMTKEELYKADSPYYSDKTNKEETQRNSDGEDKNQNVHFGLGLTICKILCKKHGGSLSLSNSVEGGAIVCAEFFVG